MTVSASGLSVVAQVVSTVMLARLLTPPEFGVVAMATTFSFVLASVGMTGFTEAVIQVEELDQYTASNLFWLTSAAGLALSVGFGASGRLLAGFYRNPLVEDVTIALSVGIFIASTSVIHLALLKRGMSFTATGANDVVGRAVNTVVAVVLAFRGWGYWALVGGIVAQQLSSTLGAWYLCRWIPSLPRRTGKTSAAVRFAANVYGQFGVRYSTQNLDNLLVGWRFNASALGFYKRAYDLFALSASGLTAPLCDVALASLSRLNHDMTRFKRYLATSLGVLAFVGMAVSADLSLVGKDVVRLVLGPHWAESGRIFQLLGPGIGAMLLCNTVGWIHVSIGKPGRWLRWTLVELAVTLSLFGLALPWGPKGIAAAWSVSYWTLLIPAFRYAGRPIGFGARALIAATWRYFAAALLAGCATAAIFRGGSLSGVSVGAGAALEAVVTISVAFVVCYLGAVILLHWGFMPLRQLSGIVGDLAPERTGTGTNRSSEPVGECE